MSLSGDEDLPNGDFLEVRINSISITQMGFIIFLKGPDENRVLPIFIGANEAQSIALAMNREAPPRPMTHDLLKNILDAMDTVVTRVEVTDIKDNTFHGRVYLKKGEVEEMDFDARPSDAMALALRWEAPIFVHTKVFEEASIPVTTSAEGETEAVASATGLGNLEPASAPQSQHDQLQTDLKRALQEERYEEAARLRDALKKLQSGN